MNTPQIGKPLSITEQAKAELNEEFGKKAKEAIKAKLRSLAAAEAIVANIKREVADLEVSIADGSF